MLGPELIGIGNRILVKGGIAIRVNKCRFCQICAWLKDHVLFHRKTPSTMLYGPYISALFLVLACLMLLASRFLRNLIQNYYRSR